MGVGLSEDAAECVVVVEVVGRVEVAAEEVEGERVAGAGVSVGTVMFERM